MDKTITGKEAVKNELDLLTENLEEVMMELVQKNHIVTAQI